MAENCEERELELLQEIDRLNQRIEELELHIESRNAGFDESRLQISANPYRQNPKRHLGNLLAAGMFPIVAGILGRIYRIIFRLK